MLKKGISIIAIVIMIIILIILSAVVIIIAANSMENSKLAVFYNNVTQIQDLVALKMTNNVADYHTNGDMTYTKWVGVANGYSIDSAKGEDEVSFVYMTNGPEERLTLIDNKLLDDTTLPEKEKIKYYVSEKGTVYYEGFEFGNEIYYNTNVSKPKGEDTGIIAQDKVSPTLVITADTTDITNVDSIKYTIKFSEAVIGFTIEDIHVVNGTKGSFNKLDELTYTIIVTNNMDCIQTISVPEGVCTDIAGNVNEQGQKVININRTVPVITISPNGNSVSKTTSITITASSTNPLKEDNIYMYCISTNNELQGNETWQEYTNDIPIIIGEGLNGNYYIHVKKVYDIAGNYSQDIISNKFVFDNSAPNIFIPELIAQTNSIKINASTSDVGIAGISHYTYGISTTQGASKTETENRFNGESIVDNLLNETTYYITVRAYDKVGNVVISDEVSTKTVSAIWAGEVDIQWYVKNISGSTYNIGTAKELAGLALLTSNIDKTIYYDSNGYANTTSGPYTTTGIDFTGKTVNITADIILNEGVFSMIGNAWYYTPKGQTAISVNNLNDSNIKSTVQAGSFAGILNGQGNSISGMYIKTTNTPACFITKLTGTIKNIHIINSYMNSTSSDASVLVNLSSEGIVDSCSVTNCYALGYNFAGGLVLANDGLIANSYNSSTIELINKCGNVYCGQSSIGGVAGYNGSNGTIVNSYNIGTIKGGCRTGGIIGYQGWCSATPRVISNYNAGLITTTYAGGFGIGWIQGGTITYCYGLSKYVTGAVGGTEGTASIANNNNATFNGSGTTWTLSGNVSPNGTATNNLLTALNAWVTANASSFKTTYGVTLNTWKVDSSKNSGMPILNWQ